MTAIFTFEVFLKVLAFGFIACGKHSYIRNAWNALDFFIVGASLLSLALPGYDLAILKLCRMTRLLRPLRAVSKNEGLKVSIKALFNSIPAIIK